jgi:two-component system, response regulator FlrC
MDLRLQSKLLRAIQEKEIDRVGGTKPVKINIRILATSNRNLPKEVSAGRFREDLYFRLNVISLQLPPLRERIEEIPALAELFVQKYSKANGLPPRPLSESAIAKLKSHSWSGNVRELENICHRAVLMASGNKIESEAILLPSIAPAAVTAAPVETATVEKLQVPAAPASAGGGAKNLIGRTVADVEKEMIIETLDYCLGNRTHAANILGISIRTLRNKIKQYSDEGAHIPPSAHEEAGG